MTSEERREARYKRRQARRRANKQKRSDAVGSLNEIFNFHDMFFYGKECCKGVRWKQSTQNFELHLLSGTAKRRQMVVNGTWKPQPWKVRPIDAPHIVDRQVQKVECNKILIPLYEPSMIIDNAASQKNKGLHWQFRRLKEQLAWHYRRYGREGAVFLMDLKKFFPNANRQLIYQRHSEVMLNPEVRAFADYIVRTAPATAPGRGMPLGVEPSQQEMVALPSAIDNYIKCQLGIHCAGHYMDDYYVILPDIDELKRIARDIVAMMESYGIRVNRRKCKIIPLPSSKGFRFCKARFTLTETGKIKMNGNRGGMKSARRKLKLFHREYLEGKRTLADIDQFMECQTAYYRNYNDHGRLLRLRRLHYALFNKYRQQEQPKLLKQTA